MKFKKTCALIALAGAMCISMAGCSDAEAETDGRTVFPVSTYNETGSVTLGDVMPFYDNGTMYIFHLQNSTGSSSIYYHPISCLTTTDYVHYNDEGVVISYEEEYTSVMNPKDWTKT